MLNALIEDLNKYVLFLKKEYDLNLSFHDFFTLSKEYPALLSLSSHTDSFCKIIKAVPELFIKCREHQLKVAKCCWAKSRCGMCYAGLEEFVYPIKIQDTNVGFISVSGYRFNPKKAEKRMRQITGSYPVSYTNLHEAYMLLKKDAPDSIFLDSLIAPAAHMYEYLYLLTLGRPENPEYNTSSNNYIFGMICEYIQNHFNEKITVEQIADIIHCSSSYINHNFKKLTGMSFSDYVNSFRLNYAKKLLSRGGSIKDACFESGFNDCAYFSKMFREKYNTTPSEYKKRQCVK